MLMNPIFTKKNLPLIVALAIPVLMILGLAAAIYLPGLGKSPAYDFVYISGSGVQYPSYQGYDYVVKDGHLVKADRPVNNSLLPFYKDQADEQQLYFYDVKAGASRELSFEEASKLHLDPATQSPDGYEVSRGGYSGGFLFFDGRSDYDHWYLRGHNRNRLLNLKLIGSYYDNFKFLGWVR